jgi:hypothetical protein
MPTETWAKAAPPAMSIKASSVFFMISQKSISFAKTQAQRNQPNQPGRPNWVCNSFLGWKKNAAAGVAGVDASPVWTRAGVDASRCGREPVRT